MDTFSVQHGPPHEPVGPSRHDLALAVIGGPTVVVDIAGLRVVVDPTFDEPTDYGYLVKTQPPSVPAQALGAQDAAQTEAAFAEAGLSGLLSGAPNGHWTVLSRRARRGAAPAPGAGPGR